MLDQNGNIITSSGEFKKTSKAPVGTKIACLLDCDSGQITFFYDGNKVFTHSDP